MKKGAILLLLAIAGACTFSSCNKSDSTEKTTTIASTWQLMSDSVIASGNMSIDTKLHAWTASSGGRMIQIFHNKAYDKDFAATTNVYKVVGFRLADSLAMDEVCIQATTSTTDIYLSTGLDGSHFNYAYGPYPHTSYCNSVQMVHGTTGSTTTNSLTTLSGSFCIYPPGKL